MPPNCAQHHDQNRRVKNQRNKLSITICAQEKELDAKILTNDTSNMDPDTKVWYMMDHEHIFYEMKLASVATSSAVPT
jgi:hypothetical protein